MVEIGKKVCIVCGKDRLKFVPWAGGLLYECVNCGYRGVLYAEIKNERNKKR